MNLTRVELYIITKLQVHIPCEPRGRTFTLLVDREWLRKCALATFCQMQNNKDGV